MTKKKIQILNHQQIQQKIDRIAYQILEDCFEEKEIIVTPTVGIASLGALLDVTGTHQCIREKAMENGKKVIIAGIGLLITGGLGMALFLTTSTQGVEKEPGAVDMAVLTATSSVAIDADEATDEVTHDSFLAEAEARTLS